MGCPIFIIKTPKALASPNLCQRTKDEITQITEIFYKLSTFHIKSFHGPEVNSHTSEWSYPEKVQ